jgi:heptosyltransferase-2
LIAAKKILVIQTSFIGDVILATSVLELLHESQPDARIDLVVKKGNETLFTEHPFVSKVWVWDKQKGKYNGLLQMGVAIRKQQYDLVINLHRFASSGLLTVFSGASHKAGYDKNPLRSFYQHTVAHRLEGMHEIERNFEVVKPYVQATTPAAPKLYPSLAHEARVEAYKQGPYRCIAPSSVWFTKQWPAEKWVALINRFASNETIYLLGAPADHAHNEGIRSASKHPNVQNLAGQLNLLESAALMKDAQMNYVNDSAPLHLCSAMDAPVRAIFCSTVPSFGFGPLSGNAKIIETPESLACRPCGLHGHAQCPKGHFKCAQNISIEQVLTSS